MEIIHLKPAPCILHCAKGSQAIQSCPFQLAACSTVRSEKRAVSLFSACKEFTMEVSTDAAAACHCLFLFAGANTVREQDVSGRVVATLLSLQNEAQGEMNATPQGAEEKERKKWCQVACWM